MDTAAAWLGLDPTRLRAQNLYGDAPRDTTHYGQVVEDNRLPRLTRTLLASSEYARRKLEVARYNERSTWHKRGLALQPVKFGISSTASLLHQAGALVLVLVYTDGTVQVNHGGTEMGQGSHTKMRAIAADTFGIPSSAVRLMTTATDKVPNTSATAASWGSDLSGAAVARACATICERVAAVACTILDTESALQLTFADGHVPPPDGRSMGDSLVPTIDRGQVEGGFVQGMGWLTTEELRFDPSGRLLTHGPSTDKRPSAGDIPLDFRVDLLQSVLRAIDPTDDTMDNKTREVS